MRQGQYLSQSIGCRSNVQELREGIDRWIRFYNFERPHQGLDGGYPFRHLQKRCIAHIHSRNNQQNV